MNNDKKRISLQVEQVFFKRIDNAAHDNRMTKSELIRIAINKYLKELENDSVS